MKNNEIRINALKEQMKTEYAVYLENTDNEMLTVAEDDAFWEKHDQMKVILEDLILEDMTEDQKEEYFLKKKRLEHLKNEKEKLTADYFSIENPTSEDALEYMDKYEEVNDEAESLDIFFMTEIEKEELYRVHRKHYDGI